MGEHKFTVGDRVRRMSVNATPRVPIGRDGVIVNADDGCAWVDWDGVAEPCWYSAQHLAEGRLMPLPADPPSVGVPDRAAALKKAVREEIDGWRVQLEQRNERMSQNYAHQQMAAQQQGQSLGLPLSSGGGRRVDVNGVTVGDWVSGKEHAALKAELEKERVARKQFGERVCELQRELAVVTGDKFRHGDILGDNAELRREKADLETQVAYLTRELVLAKGRAKGGR